MSTAFQIPEWLFQASSPPAPPVDEHRVEALVNRFIAGKQEALFTAPDAFYRLEGADAVQGRPAIADRLQTLRATTLELARNDAERAALGSRLDLHIDDAAAGIDRHVAKQRRVYHRQVVSERQALIQRAAELEHDNDDKILALAEANATAAVERARMDGGAPDSSEEGAAILGARSSILRTAINERIANRKGTQALALFDRVKEQLAPADRLSLDAPVQAARDDQLVDQWIDRESKTDGPPLQQRLETDPELPPDAKLIVRAKVDARDSADESTGGSWRSRNLFCGRSRKQVRIAEADGLSSAAGPAGDRSDPTRSVRGLRERRHRHCFQCRRRPALAGRSDRS